jgi:twinkle protein
MQKVQGSDNYEVPNLYSINGSSNWFAKADIGITVYRDTEDNISIHIQKVRFKHWGSRGTIDFKWNPENGRYHTYMADNSKWIKLTT